MALLVDGRAEHPAGGVHPDERAHLGAQLLQGPVTLRLDVAARHVDLRLGVAAALVAQLLGLGRGLLVGAVDQLPRLGTRLGEGLLHVLLHLLEAALGLLRGLDALLDLLLPLLGGLHDRRIGVLGEDAEHDHEGDQLGDEGAVGGEQPRRVRDDDLRKHGRAYDANFSAIDVMK